MTKQFTLDIEGIPKELLFMLGLLNMDDKDMVRPELVTDMNWQLFTKLAIHHRLYPLLYAKLKQFEEGTIPDYVQHAITQEYKRNTFQMLMFSAEMEQVSKWFAGIGIRTLFLKGPVLAEALYGNLSQRTSSDLDILIPINKLKRAEQLLVSQGYEKDDYIKTVLNDWRFRHHHVTFFHPVKRIKLEIHWRLNPGPGKEPCFNELWERKTRSTLTSYPVYLLSKEDLFLFLVSHGARHGWSRLRWLVDIQQLMDKEMDWKLLKRRLQKYWYLHIGVQAILLATSLLQGKEIAEMQSLLRKNKSRKLAQQAIFYLETMVSLHTEPLPKHIANYHKRHLFALMAFRQKICFILSFLYPYPEDQETLPLPTKLHLLYFPLRPFLWAWRKTKKHALP